MRMAGHMGGERVTTRNLQGRAGRHRQPPADLEGGGAGRRGSYVIIRKAVTRKRAAAPAGEAEKGASRGKAKK